jgi:hypothetical protein
MFNQYLPPELTLAQKTKKERIAQAVQGEVLDRWYYLK